MNPFRPYKSTFVVPSSKTRIAVTSVAPTQGAIYAAGGACFLMAANRLRALMLFATMTVSSVEVLSHRFTRRWNRNLSDF